MVLPWWQVVSRVTPDFYTARELADAADVPLAHVEALMASGEIPTTRGRFVAHADAVAWARRTVHARAIAAGSLAGLPDAADLFQRHAAAPREPGFPAAVSAAAHLLLGTVAVLLTTAGLNSAVARTD